MDFNNLSPISHEDEDIHTLPDYAQNIISQLIEQDLPTLILTSHGYSPPLKPTPQLKFDIRSLPNPPKHIRDAYNGTSKRLQEWMKENPAFVAKMDAIRTEIEAAMTMKTDEREKRDVLKLEPKEVKDSHRIQTSSEDEALKDKGLNIGSDQDDGEDDVESTSTAEDNDPVDERMNLRVGIYCQMGRHRSVAIVEELAKMPWPGWLVQVEHRDIVKKRGGGKKASGRDRKSRGIRGSGAYNDEGCG